MGRDHLGDASQAGVARIDIPACGPGHVVAFVLRVNRVTMRHAESSRPAGIAIPLIEEAAGRIASDDVSCTGR